MGKWNEEAAPNNNLSESELRNSKLAPEHEFSEELADGGERDEFIKQQERNLKED